MYEHYRKVSFLEAFCYYLEMNIDNPFETFTDMAFRLEGLPQYIVENEKDAFNTFKVSGEILDNTNSEWAKLVRANVASGKSMKRLRLLSDELTSYEQFELLSYQGLKVGEEIRVNSRSEYKNKYLYDFWFFDNEYITQMNYADNGTYISKVTRKASDEEKKMLTFWISVFEKSDPIE